MEEDIKILECENVGDLASIGLIDLLNEENNYDLNKLKKQALENLIKRYQLLEHRLEVADEFVEIRKKNMIPEHYDDLKYIINECDLNSSW